jgi:hypothetical protein
LTGETHRHEKTLTIDVVLDASLPPQPGEPVLIRAGTGADQPVIGLIPGTEEPTVVEENASWRKVTYKGLVGYVAR